MNAVNHKTGTIAPDPVTIKAIRDRLHSESHRYLHVYRTVQTLMTDALAELVAEIVTDYTDHLVTERDALAEDLAWELNATRTATERRAA